MDMAVLNSSLAVNMILQNWTQDTFLPFVDALVKKGFIVSQPKFVQQAQITSGPFARKGTTTDVEIDYGTRRIYIQITNNVNNPYENINEIFAVLSSLGYEPQEFIERIDIRGSVTVKVVNGDAASSFVPEIVKSEYMNKVNGVFNQPMKAVGVRLASLEPITGNVSKSPFLLLIEPLFTDVSDTKFAVQVIFLTNSSEQTIKFMQSLYSGLKQVITGMKTHE